MRELVAAMRFPSFFDSSFLRERFFLCKGKHDAQMLPFFGEVVLSFEELLSATEFYSTELDALA